MFGYGYGYGGYYGFDWTLLLLIPTMIFVFIAQAGVKNAFKTYANVRSKHNITGEQAARVILDANGLHDIRIEYISGTLSDHYDPRRRVMRLSQDVAQMPSVAAVSVAAHESGHAIRCPRISRFPAPHAGAPPAARPVARCCVEGHPPIPGPFGSLQATPVHLRNACGACISSPPSGRSPIPLSAHILRPIARAGR